MSSNVVDNLIFFVPKDRKYTLNDVFETLELVYGKITKTTIWNDEPDKIWYSIDIKWNGQREIVNTLKASLFDNNAVISVGHSVDSNHSYYYDVVLCSYKIWYFYTYEQQRNILNEKINCLEIENTYLKHSR